MSRAASRRIRRRPRRWIAVSTTSIPDPRVRRHQGNHVRSVVVTQLLDDEGVHWQRFADEPAERIGRPGDETRTSTAQNIPKKK